jgi:hypothetical protein
MAEIFSFTKPLSNLTGISNTNGSFSIFPEQVSSLNFDGTATKKEIKTKVSDIKPGQTVMVSESYYNSNSVFITKVESRNGFINDNPEQPVLKYYLYHLSEYSMEQPFTYNANYGDSYNGDTELYVIRDDIDNFELGTDGWALTNNGNAIFSNIFARGRIEATSGKIDGNLEVGKDSVGSPLAKIGSDIFEGKPFDSVQEKHSGILLDKNNYLLSYPANVPIDINSVVATNLSETGYFYSATFTLPLATGELNTLRVGDSIELSGFTNSEIKSLNGVHEVIAVGTNTFTIPMRYEADLASPVTINVSVRSFALDRPYILTAMTLSSVPGTINNSTVKIYTDDHSFFSTGMTISLESCFVTLSALNGEFEIVDKGEGYVSVRTPLIAAGTYTSSLGNLVLFSKIHKFKVGDNVNFMSFSSETGSLKLTGTINAHSGNFINQVFVGQAATTFSVFRKKLLNNIATLSTIEPHSFSVGDSVTVTDVDSTFDGTYTVKQTPTALTFTYDKVASPVTEIDLVEFGYVSSDSSVDGTIKVGIADTGISIDGTNDPETSAIYAGEGNFKNADTGFFMDASGRFSIADQLYFEDGNLTVGGTVTASAFAIDANNYWNTPGNLGDFRVGSANSYLFWNQTNSPSAGDGNLEVKGTITATAGVFSGNIQTTGKIYSGTLDGSGLLTSGIEVASTGIKGIIGGIASFILPADGVTKPTITNFEVLNAQITGDKTNAFLVAGDVGVTANNVVVRGYRGGTDQTAAIYNTKNGTATTYAGGTGFYLNDNGFFKVGTDTSNAKFDPTANSNAGLFTVTGEIQATSGYIGGTTSGWKIESSLLSNGIFGLSAPVQTLGQGTISPITHAVTAVSNKVFTSTGHTFLVGDIVRTKNMGSGGSPAGGYNGVFTINAVTTNTFTVTTSTTGTSTPVSGSATGENVITLTSPTITPLKSMSITGNTISRGTYIASISGSGPYRLTLSEVIDRDYIIGSQSEVSGTATISNYSIYSGNATKELSKFKVDYEGNVFAKTGTLGSLKLSEAGLYAKSNIVGTGYYQMGMVVNPVGFESSGFWVRKFDQSNIFAGQVSLEPSGVFWTSQNSTSAAGIYVESTGDFRIFAGKGVGNATGSSLLMSSGNMSRPWMYAQASEYIGPGNSNPILVDFIDSTLEITYSDPDVGGNGTRWVSTAGSFYAAGGIQVEGSGTANTFYAPNWFRSTGDSGWYSETYGGGIYMIDTTWVRTYNDKNFYSAGVIRAQAGLQSNASMTVEGNITITNGSLIANGTGTGTTKLQTLDMDGHIYGSGVMYDNVMTGRTMRIAASPYIFGTAGSSRRIKSYIDPIDLTDELISKYLQIQPVSYFYNAMVEGVPETELEGKVREIGLIAEDLQDLGFFGLINVDDEGIADYVHYDKISIYNIKMIQMQQERINQLENRLAALES